MRKTKIEEMTDDHLKFVASEKKKAVPSKQGFLGGKFLTYVELKKWSLRRRKTALSLVRQIEKIVNEKVAEGDYKKYNIHLITYGDTLQLYGYRKQTEKEFNKWVRKIERNNKRIDDAKAELKRRKEAASQVKSVEGLLRAFHALPSDEDKELLFEMLSDGF
jgi:hypothetical protein